MTLYLATSSSPAISAALTEGSLGRLCTPRSRNLPREGTWAADTGCFTEGDRYSHPKYLRWLDRQSDNGFADRCLFATAPDVVGDWSATLTRALPTVDEIRGKGYRVALVIQDGATPSSVPWEVLDVVFVGGSTEFKLGPDARAICEEAKAHGAAVHVGRVNSRKRYRYSRDVLGAASVDGTHISFAPDINLPQVLRWRED